MEGKERGSEAGIKEKRRKGGRTAEGSQLDETAVSRNQNFSSLLVHLLPYRLISGAMAEGPFVLCNKDMLIVKPPKKSPILLKLFLLLLAMVFSFIICFVYLKRLGAYAKPRYFLQEIMMPCHSGIPPALKPFVHYPIPKTYGRKECNCNPVRFFVILSMQRSGSGWFETLLNSHVNISSNGEVFSAKGRRSNVSAIMETLDKVYNLDWYSSASKNECSAAVGFKWMLNQGVMAFHDEVAEYFNRRSVSVIFLFRRNLLRQMVSMLSNSYDRITRQLNGTHKSHVHSVHEAQILAKYRPSINCTSLIKDLDVIETNTTKALEYFKSTRHTILYYEDLMNNRTKLADIQDFLRVPRQKLLSKQVKIHTRPLREHVKNWDDVCRVLNGTKYANFIHIDQ